MTTASGARGREVSAYVWKDKVAGRLVRSAGWLAQPDRLREARAIEACASDFEGDPARCVARAEKFLVAILDPLPAANVLGRIDAIDRRAADAIAVIERQYREKLADMAKAEAEFSRLLAEATAQKAASAGGDISAQNFAVDTARRALLDLRKQRNGVVAAMLNDATAAKVRRDAKIEKTLLLDRAEEADLELELAAKALRACELKEAAKKASAN